MLGPGAGPLRVMPSGVQARWFIREHWLPPFRTSTDNDKLPVSAPDFGRQDAERAGDKRKPS